MLNIQAYFNHDLSFTIPSIQNLDQTPFKIKYKRRNIDFLTNFLLVINKAVETCDRAAFYCHNNVNNL